MDTSLLILFRSGTRSFYQIDMSHTHFRFICSHTDGFIHAADEWYACSPLLQFVVFTLTRFRIASGFEASHEVRKVEEQRYRAAVTDALVAGLPPPKKHRSRIFALTGLAALEDKRKAFAAGVDG